MRGAVIRKRPRRVEGVCEDSSLVKNSRVPNPVGCARSTRGAAVPGRAPGPPHCIAWVNRYRCRREAEAIVTNRHRDRGGYSRSLLKSQNRNDNGDQYRQAA
jgi:hypothetical protein